MNKLIINSVFLYRNKFYFMVEEIKRNNQKKKHLVKDSFSEPFLNNFDHIVKRGIKSLPPPLYHALITKKQLLHKLYYCYQNGRIVDII